MPISQDELATIETVTVGNFPATQPVSGTVGTTQVDTSVTGTISTTDILAGAPGGAGVFISTAPTVSSFVAAAVPGGTAQADIQITGTATGTYYFEGSLDSTTGSDGNWIAVNYRQTGIINTVLGYSAVTIGLFRGAPSGFKYIRVRNIGGVAPSNPVIFRYSNGGGTTFLNASVPAGTNIIGKVGIDQTTPGSTNLVSIGTNGTVAINAAIPAGANVIGAANVNVANTSAVTVMQNAVAVTGNGTSLSVTGYGTSVVQVTGSFVASIAFEASVDAGVTWLAISATQVGQGDIFNVATVPGLYRLTVSGMDLLRARVTWTSGTSVTINGRSTNAVNASKIVKLATGGLSIGTVQMAALTKGTQGATGVSTQDLKDAGRNPAHYYTLIPVLSTATDTLQSLTGTKSGATVVATTTPAVVTTGKVFRVTRMAATYVATATSGYAVVRLRFNTAGVVAVTSPVAATLAIGVGAPVTANASNSEEATLGDGWEFAAATGIGISVQGFAAVTATAVGYVLVSLTGYEY